MQRWLPKTSIDGAELSIWGTRLVWTHNIVGVPDVHYTENGCGHFGLSYPIIPRPLLGKELLQGRHFLSNINNLILSFPWIT